ncbi:Phosphoribosylformimino-5-aminoimidazole carboxamide ribotide isomerase [Candidatus Syntrophocurvum alkaliphilum]|uniref:1-(5-phosphoribosyl)-5-[(5-phosphoribosylamino)methylideneamino] imidazole-4-carboxamide isomerase n=1 Tax=Candidatus Syntrophocurvum alkaliphilum TaxID=2293317 RepID=A0A6I6DGP8_9FIRM|nr:1-(5-phosphoribosyl)-5-[(5-phosphoribosylamino)methylideneamino]imidazole-4-carboxamide isomerase [Candidatus Syntrophocurvum alkaliphilum]QGT98819.1 Phosphoribosylformimino-5-aminoimidazole carboxamide ribotide isomerase [Candidatus Syntrophocurvum alkaliphilum]
MIIFPAIDLKEGQCVRLVQGNKDNKTVYSDSPADVALSFQNQGAEWLHVVDLDGAFSGNPTNRNAIIRIAETINIPFQVGGGLRTSEDVEKTLSIGASRVIIGTKAVSSPEFVKELLDKFGPEKIVLGLDAKDGMVAIEGWVETSKLSAFEFGLQMKELGIQTAVYTDVSRDGLLKGPNIESIEKMALETRLHIIASGGVTSTENIKDLKHIESLGVSGAIIGKALYDGKISLADALKAAKQ